VEVSLRWKKGKVGVNLFLDFCDGRAGGVRGREQFGVEFGVVLAGDSAEEAADEGLVVGVALEELGEEEVVFLLVGESFENGVFEFRGRGHHGAVLHAEV
jgi:hypothetical protein